MDLSNSYFEQLAKYIDAKGLDMAYSTTFFNGNGGNSATFEREMLRNELEQMHRHNRDLKDRLYMMEKQAMKMQYPWYNTAMMNMDCGLGDAIALTSTAHSLQDKINQKGSKYHKLFKARIAQNPKLFA